MKAPIVINDSTRIDVSGDLRVYNSIAAAELSLEGYDAGDDQLHAFDCNGLLLRIVANDPAPYSGAHLEPAEPTPTHHDVLLIILRDFLIRTGRHRTDVEIMTPEELLSVTYQRDPNPYSGVRG
jgi:hypothetical protein